MYIKGGRKRPFKSVGRKSTEKCYQEEMRRRASNGIGHDASGNQIKGSVAADGKEMGRSLYYGYNFK